MTAHIFIFQLVPLLFRCFNLGKEDSLFPLWPTCCVSGVKAGHSFFAHHGQLQLFSWLPLTRQLPQRHRNSRSRSCPAIDEKGKTESGCGYFCGRKKINQAVLLIGSCAVRLYCTVCVRDFSSQSASQPASDPSDLKRLSTRYLKVNKQ